MMNQLQQVMEKVRGTVVSLGHNGVDAVRGVEKRARRSWGGLEQKAVSRLALIEEKAKAQVATLEERARQELATLEERARTELATLQERARHELGSLEERARAQLGGVEDRARGALADFDEKARRALDQFEHRAREQAVEVPVQLRGAWEHVLASLRKDLDLPTREDFAKLQAEVEELSKKIDRLAKVGAKQAANKPRAGGERK